MFERYFGFRENPFKLDLDLAYLFWGKHQDEVIAHLRYAVIEGEGFIAITGERGVGKTILCHSFIESLDENTIAAYINSPVGSSEELLREINEQFDIRREVQPVEEFTGELNNFLMQTKLKGKKVVVFIDDAHLLKNDTLEQVRLISNLETSRHKLIQIVLVGEPKLTEMLASYNLRQIGQRVSVKYHIEPFDPQETIAYILHRLSVASKRPVVQFDQKAYRHIHKYSGGNPRAINIACNRALMKAFYRKKARISGDIVKEAIDYLNGRNERARGGFFKRKRTVWTAVGCGCLLAIAAAYYLRPGPFDASDRTPVSQKRQILGEAKKKSADKYREAPIKVPPADVRPEPSIPGPEIKEPLANKTLPDPGWRSSVEPLPESVTSALRGKQTTSASEMTHSVQVGAFRKIENAEKLAGQLRIKGYPAQIVAVRDSRDRSWHTVRIGDYPSEKAARDKADEFSVREKMESAVRPFNEL